MKTLAAFLLAAAAVAEPAALRTHDVLAHRGLVWAGRTDGLAVVDLTDPLRPKSVARLSVRTAVFGVAASGERFALAAGRLGCVLVDAADPEKLRILGSWNETGNVVDVALAGEIAFLAEGSDGWRAVDFRDPERPRSLATVSTRGRVRRLALSGTRLATAEVDGGVRVFDVAMPGTPRELLAVALEDVADVAWMGDRLLVALGSGGVAVVEGSRVVGRDTSGPAFELETDGVRAVASSEAAGVRFLDLAQGPQPRVLGGARLPRDLPAGRSSLDGDRLYVAADAGAIAVLDVADPAHPKVLAPSQRKLRVSFPD